MRTFVAVELDEACRHALAAAVEELRPIAAGVRWVRAESAHLTLKFIGELPRQRLPAAVEALGEAARLSGQFEMTVAGLSGFPQRGVPRIIHAEVAEPSGRLVELQQAVERALDKRVGIAPERRRFVPHVTLGRVKDRRRCPGVAELAAALQRQEFGSVTVERIVLMLSELRPTGALYTMLEAFPLGG